jgi:hypothetical protein
MALVLKDRVKETTTTTSTGAYTLDGAVAGYQSFSVIGDGNTTYYAVANETDWEVGIGTYTASGTTLSRDTILESSNSGNAVNWGAGSKDVFVTYPAERSMYVDGSSIVPATSATLGAANGGTGNGFFAVSGPATTTKTYTFPNEDMTVVGLSQTQTLTNKRVTPRIGTVTSAATITPTADDSDQYNVTALATNPTIAAPSGTPTDGQKLTIRLKAITSTRTLTWTTSSGGYRAIAVTLPATIPANKTVYVGCIYNSADSFWDVVAYAQEL